MGPTLRMTSFPEVPPRATSKHAAAHTTITSTAIASAPTITPSAAR